MTEIPQEKDKPDVTARVNKPGYFSLHDKNLIKIRVKYIFIFSSWFFLTAMSFKLGIGLLQEGEGKPRNIETSEVKSSNDKSFLNFASVTDSVANAFGNINSEKDKPVAETEGQVLNNEFKSSTWFSDYEAMKKSVTFYNEIHPFIYGLRGGLTNDGRIYNAWGTKTPERIAELKRLNPSVKIIPTIFRWENKNEKIAENIGMNGRSDIRDKHIAIIIGEIEKYGYDGIDIDYEGMSCEKKPKFEEFIVLLSAEMKKRNKILSIAVHPKTASAKPVATFCKGLNQKFTIDFHESWRGPLTHDYKFLARYADRIKIMAYELHPRKYRNPGPGPQAPNDWIRDIILYAKDKVPTEKLFMAIPTYGYDWGLNCSSRIKAVYFSDAQRLKINSKSVNQPTDLSQIYQDNQSNWYNLTKFMYIHKDKVYEDPSIWYTKDGCDRVAFFMNKKSFEAKMNLLRSYKIGGFSFWQLSVDNDPSINEYLGQLVRGELPPVAMAVEPPVKVTEKSAPELKPVIRKKTLKLPEEKIQEEEPVQADEETVEPEDFNREPAVIPN